MNPKLCSLQRRAGRWLLAALVWGVTAQAGAGIFDDEEARRAILDLRQKVETLRKDTEQRISDESKRRAEDSKGYAEEVTSLRRNLLDLQNQLDANAVEAAKLRGLNEQLARELAQEQRRHSDAAKALDERLRNLEPLKVSYEGIEFLAEPAEKRAFEAALASFRKGEFELAQKLFTDFLHRYAQSGYANASIFWLANAQFVGKDFKASLVSFQKLLAQDPGYTRAPEALLAVANCQIELKDVKGARKTLDDLIATYPRSEAADAAKDRLARLK
jgi:tol-pal system protein YbgF